MEKEEIQILKEKINFCDANNSESILHAVLDIRESFHKIYDKIIPKIISKETTKENVQDLIWDIREEFRHIEYHINDANLLDL